MNCQICNKQSTDKYCDSCKHIRNVYVIHKLAEKISLNEIINTNTLINKKLKNIERYDLESLKKEGLLETYRFKNYRWTSIEKINQYLEVHDKSCKKVEFFDKNKQDNLPTTDEVVLILEKEYNITDTFDEEELSANLNTKKIETKKIINGLLDERLIKKSFYGKYKLNYQEIIRYKQRNNIKEDKIKRLNKLQPPTKDSKTVISDIRDTKQRYDKTVTKKKGKKTTRKTTGNKKDNHFRKNHGKKKNETKIPIDDRFITSIREYINKELIILPRNVKDNDLTLNELYDEYREYSDCKVSRKDFDKYFHRTINTYPHIRHKRYDDTYKYNIKSRKTPQITLDKLQHDNQKFSYNEDCLVQLKENTLKVDTYIYQDELPQLYNLMIYTQENIIDYHYQKEDDKIHIEITYDLTDENPDLWLKFLKSYNL